MFSLWIFSQALLFPSDLSPPLPLVSFFLFSVLPSFPSSGYTLLSFCLCSLSSLSIFFCSSVLLLGSSIFILLHFSVFCFSILCFHSNSLFLFDIMFFFCFVSSLFSFVWIFLSWPFSYFLFLSRSYLSKRRSLRETSMICFPSFVEVTQPFSKCCFGYDIVCLQVHPLTLFYLFVFIMIISHRSLSVYSEMSANNTFILYFGSNRRH